MSHYYNEFNPESAAMIRQMMEDGLIPHGDIDTRSITEVHPDDIRHYTQCHFFAGIAGWQFALQLADWPADEPVWTGSCPCQPFSSAGRQTGKTDDRHLWPVWERLIRECRPATVFGEQVASAVAHGWLDDVYQGLEAEGYAVGAAVLPACSVGAPHIRYRLWFVAHSELGLSGRMPTETYRTEDQGQCQQESENNRPIDTSKSIMDNTVQPRLEGQPWHDSKAQGWKNTQRSVTPSGFWNDGQWIRCPDQKDRFVEPGITLLADGVQHRRPLLHAIGNAIVPQVAAQFIKATMKG